MSDAAALARQEAQDRAYVAACNAHGVEPVPPNYRGEGTEHDLIERHAHEQEGAAKNGSPFLVHRSEPEPMKELSPEAEGAAQLLDLLVPPAKADPARFVVAAGRRMIVLAWLLGRRSESLADMGRALGISRASLSAYARRLEDKLGVHGRAQKGAHTPAIYRANARKSWKLRKLNSLLTEATAEQ